MLLKKLFLLFSRFGLRSALFSLMMMLGLQAHAIEKQSLIGIFSYTNFNEDIPLAYNITLTRSWNVSSLLNNGGLNIVKMQIFLNLLDEEFLVAPYAFYYADTVILLNDQFLAVRCEVTVSIIENSHYRFIADADYTAVLKSCSPRVTRDILATDEKKISELKISVMIPNHNI
jgi:hypothetical protein